MKKKQGSKKQEINLNKTSKEVTAKGLAAILLHFLLQEWRVVVVSFSTLLLLIALYFAAADLYQTLFLQQKIKAEKQQVREKIVAWKEFMETHPEYRDGYFELAVLSYQLKEKDIALSYVREALALDPNFTTGREFEKKLTE